MRDPRVYAERGSAEVALLYTLPKRVKAKIDTADCGFLSPCWLWTAALNPDGYALLRWEGGCQRAGRVIFKLLIGGLRRDRELDHQCRRRSCVNPFHVEAVTKRINILRRDEVQLLCQEAVDAILADVEAGLPLNQIAEKHGLSPANVVCVARDRGPSSAPAESDMDAIMGWT